MVAVQPWSPHLAYLADDDPKHRAHPFSALMVVFPGKTQINYFHWVECCEDLHLDKSLIFNLKYVCIKDRICGKLYEMSCFIWNLIMMVSQILWNADGQNIIDKSQPFPINWGRGFWNSLIFLMCMIWRTQLWGGWWSV